MSLDRASFSLEINIYLVEAGARRCSIKTMLLKLWKNTCASVPFLIKLQPQTCSFIKKETPTLVFSCELCKICRNTYFEEHPRTATSLPFKTIAFLNAPRFYWRWQETVSAPFFLNKTVIFVKLRLFVRENREGSIRKGYLRISLLTVNLNLCQICLRLLLIINTVFKVLWWKYLYS